MSSKWSWTPLGVGGFVGIVLAIVFSVGVLSSWSAAVSDVFFLPRDASPDIVVVAIDDASITDLGGWPLRREVHADIIRTLHAAGAKAIGYDVNFPELKATEGDDALATALKEAKRVILPVELSIQSEANGIFFDPAKSVLPDAKFALAVAGVGHANLIPDRDGVVRRVPLLVASKDGTEIPALALRVLDIAGTRVDVNRVPRDGWDRLIVHFPDQPSRGFTVISARDVVRGAVDLKAFRDKIVFVGATAPSLHDDRLVPTSRGVPMAGVEIHASLTDTLIGKHWLREFPRPFAALGIVILSLLIALITALLRTRFAIPLLFISWVLIVGGIFAAFDAGWIVDVIWPTLTFILVYAAVTLERRRKSEQDRKELQTAFSRYVSKAVVDDLIRDPSKLKLGGERRNMTVMFSDIRGFTTISEGMKPDALVHILNIYLDRMTNLVFESGGVLDKYIGDAVMAFWNAPLNQPDHAIRAVKTMIAMRDALAQMNRDKAFGDGMDLQIGLGANTGDMVVGNIGGHQRFDYTVIGDNVNLSSRLEGLTKEYGVKILITDATARELNGQILVRRLDKVAVKGKKEPVLIAEAMELMENATAERKALASGFEAALDLYFNRQFAEAKTSAQKLLADHPGDGPSKLLLERAEAFLEHPPVEGWNGTWVYTKK